MRGKPCGRGASCTGYNDNPWRVTVASTRQECDMVVDFTNEFNKKSIEVQYLAGLHIRQIQQVA
jgi:hypothetical protein